MDDDVSKGDTPADFNKIDLTQLQGFSFGTQWTQDKSGGAANADRGGRGDQRDDRDRGGPPRRDRRAFRKPEGQNFDGGSPPSSDPGAPAGQRPAAGDRRPRRNFDGPAGRPGSEGRGEGFRRQPPREEIPYDSPYFSVTFYPEDISFNALVKTIRASCRTIELFEIARTVLAKSERFTALLARKSPEAPRPRDGELSASAPPANAAAADKAPLFISVPDGLPFESEEAAIAHVLSRHAGRFFDQAQVEIDPPKGNFQVVNRCTMTGELLGPPNYHRYNQIVQQHHAAKIRTMSLESYRSRIESVRDPEVIQQWLEKMKRVTRYTWKDAPSVLSGAGSAKTVASAKEGSPPEGSAGAEVNPISDASPAPAPAAVPPDPTTEALAPTEVPVESSSSAEAPADKTEGGASSAQASVSAEPAPDKSEAPAPLSFDSWEEARQHLLAQARDKVVRPAATARFHGRELAGLPSEEIRRSVEGALERQRRFPLDTANALRGRLRRERFTIFKKGSKGISYVCAVKRKFRVPGQVLAESIDTLIGFIEAHPMVKAGDLPKLFLGLASPEPAPAGQAAAEAAPPPPPPLTVEQRERLGRLQGDLLWLVREGYVTEFIDGGLYAPPPMSPKKEIEVEENDPEAFPEIPEAAESASAALPETPAASGIEPPPEVSAG